MGQFFHDLCGFHGVLEQRLFAFAGAIEVDVDAHRHVQFQCARPETVVSFTRVGVAAGKSLEQDGLEACLAAIFQFVDNVVQLAAQWQDADADQTLRIHGAVFFGEPAVVGAHQRFVSVVVFDAAPKLWPALLRWEQYLGIDAVALLLTDALFRAAGARRAFVTAIEWDVGVATFAAVKIGRGGGALDLVTDHPHIAAVGLAHQARRLVAILGRHAAEPVFRVDFQVRVAGNVTVLHGGFDYLEGDTSQILSCCQVGGGVKDGWTIRSYLG